MKNKKSYFDEVHFYGRVWMICALLLFLAIPLSISISLNAWPTLDKFLIGYLPILSLFGPVAIIEIITYGPMLGSGGTYLGFVTGNLSNLKVPCALSAMENNQIPLGTEQGEVVSTIAVGVSSIVTTLILFAGVLGFAQIMPILDNPALSPAFANLLPSLFGGLAVVFISKNYKLAVFPVLFMLILYFIIPSIPVSILIPLGAIISIMTARILYKKKII